MHELDNLFQYIKGRVWEKRGVDTYDFYPGNTKGGQAYNRAAFIFVLEMILHKYRMEHATIFEPLEGRKALHHMIFTKTNWKLEYIRTLSLADCLFVIHDELKISKLPEDAKSYISGLNIPENTLTFDEVKDEEWDAMGNFAYLQTLKMNNN
ncbi:TPA: hypothetical protein SLO38_004539 [Citrobacter koseri]|nr:hypothetical protein [Citrobacter koseri]